MSGAPPFTTAPTPAVTQPDVYTRTPSRIDAARGVCAMRCVIASETALFLVLFFTYFYLATPTRWQVQEPPKLTYALVMLVLLVISSFVLSLGERQVLKDNYKTARGYALGTILLGLAFVALQIMETKDHWKTLTAHTDAYGSVFYTITGFHAAHLAFGLLILAYIVILPKAGHEGLAPHQPYRVAAMYWHFVDIVWFFIVAIMYIAPHFQR